MAKENLDRVIKAVKCCTTIIGCYECPYSEGEKCTVDCQLEMNRDALSILKALADSRQARVIRKGELGSLPGGCVVWMENYTNDDYESPMPVSPVCVDGVKDMQIGDELLTVVVFSDGYDPVSEYGKCYRLWTARPTDEQRRGEPWSN